MEQVFEKSFLKNEIYIFLFFEYNFIWKVFFI